MASTYFTRTTGTSTDNKKFTFSSWVKRDNISSSHTIFGVDTDSSNYIFLRWKSNGDLQFSSNVLGTGEIAFVTDRVFRDESAWYHIVVAVDSTLSTASDRVKIYINGIRETSFSTSTTPAINKAFAFLNNGTFEIGRRSYDTSNIYSGSMAMVEFVDGQQYGPEYFGSFNSASGIWTPTGATAISNYGTNGFKLKMDTTSPGADTSGKGNTFTASGTPTLLQGNPQNNWATWNVLQSQYFWGAAETSFATNGNTTLGSGTSQYGFISGTMGISKGKWYWETKINSETGGSQFLLGIASTMPRSATNHLGGNQYDYGMYSQNGNIYTSNASSSFAASYTVGDILSIAIDYDNAKLYFAKNGAWSTGSGAWGSSTFNAATGAKTITTPPPKPTATPGVGTGFYFPAFSYWDGSNRGFISTNFGEGFFGTTAAGTNADDNGQGLFAYDVPSGYYAMNTKNLEAYG